MFSFYFLVVESINRIKATRVDPVDSHLQQWNILEETNQKNEYIYSETI